MKATHTIAFASIVIGLVALAPLSSVSAAGAALSLKSAAQVQASSVQPGTQYVTSTIRKVMGDYATVALSPAGGGEDQIVVLRKTGPEWTPIAGPSTTFMPSVITSVPAGLLNQSSYLSLRLQAAVDAPAPSRQFNAGGLRFNCPDTAAVDGKNGAATVVGNGYRLGACPTIA